MKPFYKVLLGIIFFAGAAIAWLLLPAAGIPILAYHMVNPQEDTYSIDPAEFERQMRYLTENGYTAISLKELFQASGHPEALPAKPVVITFDDGYEDNYSIALPILQKYGMKGTVFVVAANVGTPGYLTWQQIKEMQLRYTEIGSHTLTHVTLRDLNYAEQVKELADSKKILETQLGQPVEFLAYPYGGYNESVINALKQTGYLGACTGKTGLNTASTPPYFLKRISVPKPKYGMWEFRLRLLRANIYEKIGIR